MPNMAVQYRGPNPALLTLTKELRARFGDPARTYEFVTGYKSPGNYSGHNPDNNGIVHAVDIFVGPGNLTAAQGIDAAERLRQEGLRGTAPGVPARVSYLIHNRRIAGGSEGWAWRPYTGADPHIDHIHVSTADTYWGDRVALDPSNYNTASPWNLWAAVPLTTTKPAPIQEDDMPLTAQDKKDIAIAVWGYKNSALERDDAYALLRAIRDRVLVNPETAKAVQEIQGRVTKYLNSQTAEGLALDREQVGLLNDLLAVVGTEDVTK